MLNIAFLTRLNAVFVPDWTPWGMIIFNRCALDAIIGFPRKVAGARRCYILLMDSQKSDSQKGEKTPVQIGARC